MAALRHINFLKPCGQTSNTPALTIKQHLEDRLVYEGEKVYLKCEINGHTSHDPVWYKNGTVLCSDQRVRFTTGSKWYKLELIKINPNDHGVYTITLRDKNDDIFSSARILVGPPKERNIVLYTSLCPRQSLNLVKALINVTVHTEQNIKLEAEFKTEAISTDHIIWYKDNKRITPNERIEINSTLTTSTLYVEYAILTDSGIYTVISRTSSGVNSSIGIVQVVDIDLTNYNTDLPRILSHVTNRIEISDQEELRLICKAKFDSNTDIEWYKDGSMIDNPSQFTELTGYDYAELKVSPTNYTHSGTYTVTFTNRISGRSVFSQCHVTVKPITMSSPPTVLERKSLSSAIANYGAEVIFDCCYEIVDPLYFYVVWYVGAVRVEHSNARFNVVCNNGEYLLRIKKLEPCMTGEVTCQLWQFLPKLNRRVQIAETSCTLSIVPDEILADEERMTTVRCHPTIHIMNPSPEERRLPIADHPLRELFMKPSLAEDPERPDNTLLEINLSIGDDNFYYYLDVTMRAPSMAAAEITIREAPPLMGRLRHTRMYILEWTEPDIDFRPWYAVEIERNGKFKEAAINNKAVFYLKDLGEGKCLRIRIRTAQALEAPKIFSRSSQEVPITHINSRDYFLGSYKFCSTPERFCSRGVGLLEIVQSHSGDYFATRHVRTEKKENNAMREFEVMRKLQHTNIIKLIDVWANHDFCIFVTELLWGGDIFTLVTEDDQIHETDIVTYIRQILSALEYLHSLQIAHFDIKPENIFSVRPNSTEVKLVNFGSARILNEDNLQWAIYGAKHYVSPEMISFDELTVASDMWSFGVLTYLLLSGTLPFKDTEWQKLSPNITKANYNFNEPAFMDVSEPAKDFIKNLLVSCPNNRITASDALNHKWIVTRPPVEPRHLKKTKDNIKYYLATRSTLEAIADTAAATKALAMQSKEPKMDRSKIDLLTYSGSASEWLHFKRSYESTKPAFSSLENVARLRNALRGHARVAVASLLLSTEDPQDIMHALERSFACPEMIVLAQVHEIRTLPRLGNDLKEIGTIANKVRNSLSVMKLLGQEEYVSSPALFYTVLGKLNYNPRQRWSDFAADFDYSRFPCSKLEVMSKFLTREHERHTKYGMSTELLQATQYLQNASPVQQNLYKPPKRESVNSVSVTKNKPLNPMTGDLPPQRLAHHKRPFTYTGVDYFGPLNTTIGRRQEKRWVALFTCMTTRAVHIELVHTLSADSTIMSLRRFIARRGTPDTIYSDNGTCFVGANRLLKEFYQPEVQDFAANKGIKWSFIPAAAPFFGGCWERLIRSIKVALNATLHKELLRKKSYQLSYWKQRQL